MHSRCDLNVLLLNQLPIEFQLNFNNIVVLLLLHQKQFYQYSIYISYIKLDSLINLTDMIHNSFYAYTLNEYR